MPLQVTADRAVVHQHTDLNIPLLRCLVNFADATNARTPSTTTHFACRLARRSRSGASARGSYSTPGNRVPGHSHVRNR
jgi:hypothetical protein